MAGSSLDVNWQFPWSFSQGFGSPGFPPGNFPGNPNLPPAAFPGGGNSPPPKSVFWFYFFLGGGFLLLLCCGCAGLLRYWMTQNTVARPENQAATRAIGSEASVLQSYLGSDQKMALNQAASLVEQKREGRADVQVFDCAGTRGRGQIIHYQDASGAFYKPSVLRLPDGYEVRFTKRSALDQEKLESLLPPDLRNKLKPNSPEPKGFGDFDK